MHETGDRFLFHPSNELVEDEHVCIEWDKDNGWMMANIPVWRLVCV